VTDREALLAAVVRDPADELAWLALADALEESGEQPRAEVLRLSRQLRALTRKESGRDALEKRLGELLASGVRPCVPEHVNALGVRFVLIPPGRFWREDTDDRAAPPEEVTVRRAFWLSQYAVTQEEYERVMHASPSHHPGPTRPVEGIDLGEMVEFLDRVATMTGEAGRLRLPTEDEWEHACRAGSTTAFHVGADLSTAQANCRPEVTALNLPRTTRPVGSYPPNAFGLYDMHGNVYELCYGTDREADLVAKGGSCQMRANSCASSASLDVSWVTEGGANDLGFRVLREWR
jgi:uncharacterized protein (TIGR02996 family)